MAEGGSLSEEEEISAQLVTDWPPWGGRQLISPFSTNEPRAGPPTSGLGSGNSKWKEFDAPLGKAILVRRSMRREDESGDEGEEGAEKAASKQRAGGEDRRRERERSDETSEREAAARKTRRSTTTESPPNNGTRSGVINRN
jgi:hypothetical protein